MLRFTPRIEAEVQPSGTHQKLILWLDVQLDKDIVAKLTIYPRASIGFLPKPVKFSVEVAGPTSTAIPIVFYDQLGTGFDAVGADINAVPTRFGRECYYEGPQKLPEECLGHTLPGDPLFYRGYLNQVRLHVAREAPGPFLYAKAHDYLMQESLATFIDPNCDAPQAGDLNLGAGVNSSLANNLDQAILNLDLLPALAPGDTRLLRARGSMAAARSLLDTQQDTKVLALARKFMEAFSFLSNTTSGSPPPPFEDPVYEIAFWQTLTLLAEAGVELEEESQELLEEIIPGYNGDDWALGEEPEDMLEEAQDLYALGQKSAAFSLMQRSLMAVKQRMITVLLDPTIAPPIPYSCLVPGQPATPYFPQSVTPFLPGPQEPLYANSGAETPTCGEGANVPVNIVVAGCFALPPVGAEINFSSGRFDDRRPPQDEVMPLKDMWVYLWDSDDSIPGTDVFDLLDATTTDEKGCFYFGVPWAVARENTDDPDECWPDLAVTAQFEGIPLGLDAGATFQKDFQIQTLITDATPLSNPVSPPIFGATMSYIRAPQDVGDPSLGWPNDPNLFVDLGVNIVGYENAYTDRCESIFNGHVACLIPPDYGYGFVLSPHEYMFKKAWYYIAAYQFFQRSMEEGVDIVGYCTHSTPTGCEIVRPGTGPRDRIRHLAITYPGSSNQGPMARSATWVDMGGASSPGIASLGIISHELGHIPVKQLLLKDWLDNSEPGGDWYKLSLGPSPDQTAAQTMAGVCHDGHSPDCAVNESVAMLEGWASFYGTAIWIGKYMQGVLPAVVGIDNIDRREGYRIVLAEDSSERRDVCLDPYGSGNALEGFLFEGNAARLFWDIFDDDGFYSLPKGDRPTSSPQLCDSAYNPAITFGYGCSSDLETVVGGVDSRLGDMVNAFLLSPFGTFPGGRQETWGVDMMDYRDWFLEGGFGGLDQERRGIALDLAFAEHCMMGGQR